jgi:hypothetical protein
MMSLEEADILELKGRYYSLLQKYVDLSIELAPKLDKFGRYRKELQLLTVEFANRGVTMEDPVELVKQMKDEAEKRKQMSDAERKDNNQG